MLSKNFIKIKWFKVLLSGINFSLKKTSGSFLLVKNIGQNIINWNKLLFYFKYQLCFIKHIIMSSLNILFVTDSIYYSVMLQSIAIKINCFFVVGPWIGGRLTSFNWSTNLPGCIINCGTFFIKNLYNEILVTSLPCFNLICNLRFFKFFGISYSNPLNIKESNIIYSLCFFFGYVIKKYKQNIYFFNKKLEDFDYNLVFFNKLNAIYYKTDLYIKSFDNYINFKYFRLKIFKNWLVIKKKNYLLFSFFSYLQKILYFKKYYVPIFIKKKLSLRKKLNKKNNFLFKNFIFIEVPYFYSQKLNIDFISELMYKKVIFNWFIHENDNFMITKMLLNVF